MPTRKPLRLPGYDYSAAGSFVAACIHQRRCLLAVIDHDAVSLTVLGHRVDDQLRSLRDRVSGVEIDCYAVMPNHVHAIFQLGSRARQASPLRLGNVVAAFKSASSREINELRRTSGAPVWQRGYYEHVVRDAVDLARIREYVATNPIRWALDPENPACRP